MRKDTMMTPHNTSKRGWTLRKGLLMVFLIITLGGVVASFVLAFLGSEPNSDVACQLITIWGATFIGYLTTDQNSKGNDQRF